MNIVIGKLGKSILFNSKNWGAIGGDLDAPIFYENLITKQWFIDEYQDMEDVKRFIINSF